MSIKEKYKIVYEYYDNYGKLHEETQIENLSWEFADAIRNLIRSSDETNELFEQGTLFVKLMEDDE